MQQVSEAHVAAIVKVQCLSWVWGMVCSKELYLAEQSLYELEAEEAKMGSNPTAVETANTQVVESLSLVVYPSPLADPFFFGFSFFLTA